MVYPSSILSKTLVIGVIILFVGIGIQPAVANIQENHPPEAPTIEGPSYCKRKVEYEYRFNSVDPDDDMLSYYIDWGDGYYYEWMSYVPSGWDLVVNHSWNKRFVVIRAKARDVLGAESDWSEFMVIFQKTRTLSYPWFLKRFPMLERLLIL